jgi:dTDP-4-dehydrorhamnose reductase
MRVFITGAGGQVGHELAAAFARDDVTAADHQSLDVTDRSSVLAAITTARPHVILHAAAWTAVDACESDPDTAYSINTLGTRHIADAAHRIGARVVYFSTDYVFDGAKSDAYVEWDAPNPQSVYGQTKLAGEREVAEHADATIVRLSWVCGYHGTNMVKTVLRLASQRAELAFVDDQRGHPTFAEDVAPLVRRLVSEQRPGLFHMTNQGVVTWYEFATAVFEAAGHDPTRIKPIKTAELKPARPAPRPTNSVLDNMALRLQGIPLLPDYRSSLERLVSRLTES